MNKRTILLVEAEATSIVIQRNLLESCGYSVVVAESGEQAIEITNVLNKIDLILMDIFLPGIGGIEAAKKILQKKKIPLVFLSFHPQSLMIERLECLSYQGYIEKPLCRNSICACIERILNRPH